MRTSPPPTAVVRAALARLGREGSLAAALHLALPIDVPANAVQSANGRLRWRTVRIAIDDDVTRLAAIVALGGHREGDRYLDLDGDPIDLVKWIRSGTRWYAWGLDTVLGGPSLTADVGVALSLRRTLVGMAVDRRRPVPPFVVDGEGGSCLVEGDDDTWYAVAGTGAVPQVTGTIDRSRLALSVVERLGGDLEVMDEAAVVVIVGGRWVITVPLVCHGTSAFVGVTTVVPGDLPPTSEVPEGFNAVGFDDEGTLVVSHRASGIRALLTGDLFSW